VTQRRVDCTASDSNNTPRMQANTQDRECVLFNRSIKCTALASFFFFFFLFISLPITRFLIETATHAILTSIEKREEIKRIHIHSFAFSFF
jgi:hypothetical protein